MSTWRQRMAGSIARVLSETRGQTDAEIKRALRAEWASHGMGRENHPYQIWLDEIRRQRFPERYVRPLRRKGCAAGPGETLPGMEEVG